MTYLALDLGSTYTKICRIVDGRVEASRQAPTPAPLPGSIGRYEIDAEAYFAEAETLLREMRTAETTGVLLSTQMHGYVLTDRSFRPLSPYVSWQDGVGAAHLAEIREQLEADAVAPAGVPLKGNLALCSLLGRQLEGEALPQDALFCTLGGYMIGRLTGVHACHLTNAAPTGLCDVREACWNEVLLHRTGLEAWVFPALFSDVRPVGNWEGLTVYPDLGDQQVCAFGAGLRPERDLHMSLGTAGLMGCLAPRWSPGPYEQRPWLTSGLYLRTVSGLPGGRHVAAMHGLLRHLVETLSGAAVDDGTVWRFLSGITADSRGERPLFKALQGTPEGLVADFYTQMAEAFAQAAEQMGTSPERIVFSGGCAAKNPALRRAFRERFACEADERDHDAMLGMQALAVMLDRR